jgi:uncharacterized membrane protein YphA (DoxX/SURF4 family)
MDTRLNSAFWALRIGFGAAAFLAGLDKFFNLLVNWAQYLSPLFTRFVPISTSTAMSIVGVIEMAVGILVLSGVTRIGGYVVMAWLTLIALNLITTGRFFDIAVRDLLLSVGAYTMARLTEAREADAVGVAARVHRPLSGGAHG